MSDPTVIAEHQELLSAVEALSKQIGKVSEKSPGEGCKVAQAHMKAIEEWTTLLSASVKREEGESGGAVDKVAEATSQPQASSKFVRSFVHYVTDYVFGFMAAVSGTLMLTPSTKATVWLMVWVRLIMFALSILLVVVLRNMFLFFMRHTSPDGALHAIFHNASSAAILLPWLLRLAASRVVDGMFTLSTTALLDAGKGVDQGIRAIQFVTRAATLTVAFGITMMAGARAQQATSGFYHMALHLTAESVSGTALKSMLDTLIEGLRPDRERKRAYIADVVAGRTISPDAIGLDNPVGFYLAEVTQVVVITLATIWLIGCLSPRLSRASKNPFQSAQAEAISYSCCFAWAFFVTDFLWDIVYAYVGSHIGNGASLALFWSLIIPLLVASALIVRWTPGAPTYNYWNPNKHGARTAQLMIAWMVGFVAWYGWFQVINLAQTSALSGQGSYFEEEPTGLGLNKLSPRWPALFFTQIGVQLGFFVGCVLWVCMINWFNGDHVKHVNARLLQHKEEDMAKRFQSLFRLFENCIAKEG